MSYRDMIFSALAGGLLLTSLTVNAGPPHYYGPPPRHDYGDHHPPPPPPPPRYGHYHGYDGAWVAPAIIGGIGLGYLLSQPSPQTVIVERPAPPSYQQRCDETTVYDRYGNRTTTRTCY